MKYKVITDISILKQKSENVGFWESRKIIKDLEDTLKEYKTGIGLSAIQIGIPKKVSIIRFDKYKINLVNAEIVEKSKRFRMKQEGCLSFPGLFVDTSRYDYIRLDNGKEYTGLLSVAIQHELDHERGLVFLDRKWRKR